MPAHAPNAASINHSRRALGLNLASVLGGLFRDECSQATKKKTRLQLKLLEVLANFQADRVDWRALAHNSIWRKRAGPMFEISGVGVLAAFLGGALLRVKT